MKSSIRNEVVRALRCAAVSFLWVLPVAAQDCPELLGRWPYGPAGAVAVSGDKAFVSSGTTLLVIDVSTPNSPQLLGDVDMPEMVRAVAAAGSHAYVATGYSGLRVVDVSVPSAPVEVGFIDTPGNANGVAVSGSYAYLADGSSGLRVISIVDSSAPVEAGFIDTPGNTNGVAVSGSYAYLADGSSGLRVISVADPSSPVELGFVDTPGYAYGVEVSGSYAYLADGSSGLRVISVADPSSPVESGFFDTQGSALDVAVAGGLAFVADEYSDVPLIDVSTPTAPVPRGSLDIWGKTVGVVVSGGLAYVVGEFEGLVIGEFSDPDAPTRVAAYQTAGLSQGVAVAGRFAYVGAAGPDGLRVLDMATPSTPVEVGWVDTPDHPQGVVISGGHAFLSELNAGLQVINLDNPLAPVPVGLLDTPGEARGVWVVGDTAYVADGSAGLLVVDVSEPGSPIQLGALDTPGDAYGVAVADGYAYVADKSAGLRVINVSTPGSPTEVGFLETPETAWAVAVAGDHAFLAGDAGLRVIDVSAPATPQEVGFVDLPTRAIDIELLGNRAYVAVSGSGLAVVDIGDPTAPVEIGIGDTPGSAQNLAIFSGTVVVADSRGGVAVFDDCVATAFESFIPAAAVAAGAQGAFFQTDVEINNRGEGEAQVTFQWLPRGMDNSQPAASDMLTLAPGQSMRFEDVLSGLFGLEPDSLGALKLVSNTRNVIGMSRTYNIPGGKAAGTFGQGLPAVQASEMITGTKPRRIIFLSENTDSRANVGCVNGSGEDLRINMEVFDDEGSTLETRTMDLGPYSNDQINRVLNDWKPVNGSVDVWGDSDGALFYCYGSMLDNVTSDATTILPQMPFSTMTFIPAAALAAGLEGAFFQTDVDLKNVGSTAINYQFLWLPRGADNSLPSGSYRFSLAAGSGVRYANVLSEVFGLKPDRVGALAVSASGSDLLAMSRTYNLPSGDAAGTFGQAIPGIPSDRMIRGGQRKRIIFMNENAELRSNVGCQNGSKTAIRVFVELFDSEGQSLEVKTMNLAPMSNNQITRVFRSHAPIEAGYVDVWSDDGEASFYCYGSVLDNQTSDPMTVLPQ